MADGETPETPPKTDEAIKRVKTQTRKAAVHLRAVVAEPAAEIKDDADEGLVSLRQQIADLARQVEQYAGDRLEDAQGLVSNAADAGTVLAARAGRQTLATARAVQKDPLPLVVGLGVLALLTAIVLGNATRR